VRQKWFECRPCITTTATYHAARSGRKIDGGDGNRAVCGHGRCAPDERTWLPLQRTPLRLGLAQGQSGTNGFTPRPLRARLLRKCPPKRHIARLSGRSHSVSDRTGPDGSQAMVYALTHEHTHAYIRHGHARMQANTNKCTHTHTHMHAHAHARAHTHTEMHGDTEMRRTHAHHTIGAHQEASTAVPWLQALSFLEPSGPTSAVFHRISRRHWANRSGRWNGRCGRRRRALWPARRPGETDCFGTSSRSFKTKPATPTKWAGPGGRRFWSASASQCVSTCRRPCR
jgi:hypothetical protein